MKYLVCFILGYVLSGIVFIFVEKTVINEVEFWENQENLPRIIRLYKIGNDSIFVADPKNPGEFIRLSSYLKTIPDKGERELQEVLIKKRVDWYK